MAVGRAVGGGLGDTCAAVKGVAVGRPAVERSAVYSWTRARSYAMPMAPKVSFYGPCRAMIILG